MKRALLIIALGLLALGGTFAQDFSQADTLHDQRKLTEELAILRPKFNPADPQANVVWRIIRATQEVAAQMPAGKDKFAKFDEAIEFGKPLVDTAKGSTRDRAKVLYWYTVSMSQKGKAKGVLNSLFMLGDLRSQCDRVIAMDPGYGDPYYLKSLIDDAVPSAVGGDKARMGVNFAKAIQCDPQNLSYYVDFAIGLKNRGKAASYNAAGDKGVPAGKSDMDYAQEIAAKAKALFATYSSPIIGDKEKMAELKAAGF